MDAHAIQWSGTGPRRIAKCSCGKWAWLGTYEGAKGRMRKALVDHQRHVVRATGQPWQDPKV